MKLIQAPVAKIRRNPLNARKVRNRQKFEELCASVMAHGIKIPCIGFHIPLDEFGLTDGHERLDAAIENQQKHVPMVVFDAEPSERDLLLVQLTINEHRENLNPVDRYEAACRLAELSNWTANSQFAEGLSISPSKVTHLLAIGDLTLEERELVREGKLGLSAAYALKRLPDEERAAVVLQAAAGEAPTRDVLFAKARRKGKPDAVKAKRIAFNTANALVSLAAERALGLDEAIEIIEGLARELKKARGQKLDISTAARVLRDQSKAAAG